MINFQSKKLVGDFNIDLLKVLTKKKYDEYFNLILSYSYIPAITSAIIKSINWKDKMYTSLNILIYNHQIIVRTSSNLTPLETYS